MEFDWDPEKNRWLGETRGVSFEEMICLMDDGYLRAILRHSKKAHQKIFVIERDGYVYNMPFVENDEGVCFLKTIYPSRVSTKRFLEGEKK
jgi:hypothetical protein